VSAIDSVLIGVSIGIGIANIMAIHWLISTVKEIDKRQSTQRMQMNAVIDVVAQREARDG
jgi:hypothetical protein